MTDFPTPEEIAGQERAKEILAEKDTPFLDRFERLTEKEKHMVLLVLTRPDLPDREKAIMAGYSEKTSACSILKQIEGPLGQILMELSLTEADIARGLMDGLNAMSYNIHHTTGKDGKVTTKITETPNWSIRHRYLQTLMKHGSYFPAEKFDHTHKHQLEEGAAIAKLRQRNERVEAGEIPPDYEAKDDRKIN